MVPAGALLSSFAPATGIYTYVAERDETSSDSIVGQFYLHPGRNNARLTFITPEEEIESPDVMKLLDHLAARAGERGAHNLLAEVNVRSEAYEVLRKAGFAIYARQRVWNLGDVQHSENLLWRQVVEKDEYHVHYLYHSLVPALVQQTEPPPWENMNGLIYANGDETLGYVHLSYGPKGIIAQPFVHPDTDHAEELLTSIYAAIPNIRSRPVYLCVRSHQAWLAPFLDELDLESGPRQAVMVKRLAIPTVEPVKQTVNTGISKASAETSSFSVTRVNEKNKARLPWRMPKGSYE